MPTRKCVGKNQKLVGKTPQSRPVAGAAPAAAPVVGGKVDSSNPLLKGK
jgi:hypothetical protein